MLDNNGKIKDTDTIIKEVNEPTQPDYQDDPFSFLEKAFPESPYVGNENTLAIPNFLIRGSNGTRKPFLFQYLFDKITWIGSGATKIGDSAVQSGCEILNAKKGVAVDRKSDDLPVVQKIKNLFLDPNSKQKFPQIYKQLIMDLTINSKAYVIFDFLEDSPPFKNPIAMYRADFRCIRPIYLQDYLQNNGYSLEQSLEYKNRIVAWSQESIFGLESFEEKLGRTSTPVPWIVGTGIGVRYFYPEQVMEIKLNATGTSCLEALEDSISTEIAAKKYTYAYFKNATKTGAVYSMEKGTSADAETNKKWLQNNYSSPAGAWKPLFLLGGVKMVASGANVSDVQYLEIRRFIKEECCDALGIPYGMFGSASEEDKENFENDAVSPKEIVVCDAFQKHLEEIFYTDKGRFIIQPGTKGRVTQRTAKIAQVQTMAGGTINEGRILMKKPPIAGNALYDEPVLVSNLMPVSLLEKTIDAKNAGPTVVRDNNPGQRRKENIQGGKSGIVNEQR
jgi:hypothetical protein